MKIRDERVEQFKNKIYGELFQWMYLFIVASFIVKSLYFKMNLSQCITEYVILIVAPLYQMVRSRQLGVVLTADTHQHMSLKRNIVAIIAGLVIFFAFWLTSGRQVTAEFAFGYIASFSVVFFVVRVIFIRLEEHRMKKLEQEYED